MILITEVDTASLSRLQTDTAARKHRSALHTASANGPLRPLWDFFWTSKAPSLAYVSK